MSRRNYFATFTKAAYGVNDQVVEPTRGVMLSVDAGGTGTTIRTWFKNNPHIEHTDTGYGTANYPADHYWKNGIIYPFSIYRMQVGGLSQGDVILLW
jgi:hypothetical protein